MIHTPPTPGEPTDVPGPNARRDPVERWLADQRQTLLEDTRAGLDAEAGLREILLADDHAAVHADTTGRLDIEAGLTAITGPLSEPAPPAPASPAGTPTTPTADLGDPEQPTRSAATQPGVDLPIALEDLHPALRSLAALPALERLKLDRDLDRMLTATRAVHLARALAHGLVHAISLARSLTRVDAVAVAVLVLVGVGVVVCGVGVLGVVGGVGVVVGIVGVGVARHLICLVLTSTRTSARARGLARDLAHASGLARGLARADDRVRDLARDLAHASDLVRNLARADDRVRDLARDLAHASDLATDLVRNLARVDDRVRDLARDLANASDLATDLAQDFARADDRVRGLARARALVRVLDDTVERVRGCARPARDGAASPAGPETVAEAVLCLPPAEAAQVVEQAESLLFDMRGADLRAADRAGLRPEDLARVRWSCTTRWPRGWRRWVADNSVVAGPGVWVVRPGTASADDPAALRT